MKTTVTMALFLSAAWIQAQPAAPERARYQAASLKRNPGCEKLPGRGTFSPSPGRLEIPCVTLASLIQTAYGTFADGVTLNAQPLQREGGPAWMQSEYYSLSAKAAGPVRAQMLAGPMLQAFLEDRFRLKTHRETREVPSYAMTVGKGGLKIRPLAEGACTPLDPAHPPAAAKIAGLVPNLCDVTTISTSPKGDMTTIEVRGSTMAQLAQRLSGRAGHSVVDKTGMTGMFNFHVEFATDPTGVASLFAALEQQIGLKVSPEKGSVSVLIVDRAEKPAED